MAGVNEELHFRFAGQFDLASFVPNFPTGKAGGERRGVFKRDYFEKDRPVYDGMTKIGSGG